MLDYFASVPVNESLTSYLELVVCHCRNVKVYLVFWLSVVVNWLCLELHANYAQDSPA